MRVSNAKSLFPPEKNIVYVNTFFPASRKISIYNSVGHAPALLYNLMCCDKLICVREHVQCVPRCVDLARNETESLLTVAKKAMRFWGLEAVTSLSTPSTAFGHIWLIFVSCGFVVIVLKFFLKLFGIFGGSIGEMCRPMLCTYKGESET